MAVRRKWRWVSRDKLSGFSPVEIWHHENMPVTDGRRFFQSRNDGRTVMSPREFRKLFEFNIAPGSLVRVEFSARLVPTTKAKAVKR